MPYKSEKIKIAGTKLDLRRKLSDSQKEAIKILSEKGYSQRKLADMFGCSKRSIQNIISPQKRCKQAPKPKEYWTEKKRLYRQRKHKLFVDGKLGDNKKRTKQ